MQCEKCGKKVYANEICSCGLKAPKKNNGIVRINTIVCFIALMLSVLCLVITLSLRTISTKKLISESITKIELADIQADDGKKLDQYIYDEYINDPRISVENVDNLLKEPFIKDFLLEKVELYRDFVLDDGELPYVTADEIVKLIDDNASLLFNEAGLRFLEGDKTNLRSDLSYLDEFERFSHDFLDTAFGTRLVQTFFSYANVIFLIIFMGVIFIQWLIIYKANNRRVSKMIYKYGFAVSIPSALLLIAALTFKLDDDLEIADKLLGSSVTPFLLFSTAFLAMGILLSIIGITVNKNYKTSKAEVGTTEIKPSEIASSNEEIPDKKVTVCPKCLHENKENAAFCSRCGTKLK